MSKAKEIILDDGLQSFSFRNKRGDVIAEFSFNPSDTGLLTRYDEVVKAFDGLEIDEEKSLEEQIVFLDEELKKQFDYLLNGDMSATLFAKYTPCTVFADGDFFAEHALKCIGVLIEEETGARLDKKLARIKRDSAKNRK